MTHSDHMADTVCSLVLYVCKYVLVFVSESLFGKLTWEEKIQVAATAEITSQAQKKKRTSLIFWLLILLVEKAILVLHFTTRWH